MCLLLLGAPCLANPYAPTTLQVGPGRALKTPSEAARLARSGDIIEIDAGLYLNDYASWEVDNLTIRGVGGMAHMESHGLIPNGKAIWIVSGDNTVIENLEFSGARVADTNGAGIRHEGGNLTLRNAFFHHNEFSILTGAYPKASLEIQSSRFWFQKREKTFSHGIYIGALKRFTLIGSHIKGTDRGHQIKSRALENRILYNRIEDIPGGNSSRLVDLPNCGLSYIIGNDMQQAETTLNIDAIGYGAEGCEGRSAQQQRLFVVNNTFVNEAWNGTLVKNHAGGEVLVANNLVFGRGLFLIGKGNKLNNVALNLSFRQPGSWDPPSDSAAIDAAQVLPAAESFPLVPTREFSLPEGTVERQLYGSLDIGSRELLAPGPTQDAPPPGNADPAREP
ncbi:MAG: right-handed parallel beta-helix repeat-containing protein [Halioglobus sp.]